MYAIYLHQGQLEATLWRESTFVTRLQGNVGFALRHWLINVCSSFTDIDKSWFTTWQIWHVLLLGILNSCPGYRTDMLIYYLYKSRDESLGKHTSLVMLSCHEVCKYGDCLEQTRGYSATKKERKQKKGKKGNRKGKWNNGLNSSVMSVVYYCSKI